MKITKEDMKIFSRFLENEIKKIDSAIARFRHMNQNLDFEVIQAAIFNMAVHLPEFWEPGSDNGSGGVKANLIKPGPTKSPSNKKTILVK